MGDAVRIGQIKQRKEDVDGEEEQRQPEEELAQEAVSTAW